ncbi:MAG: diguanylate cyclase [Erythrobacter sp.]
MDGTFDGKIAGVLARAPVDFREIEREAVIAMLERERRSLVSSFLGFGLLALGVAMLPNPAPMGLLLMLRLGSLLFTRSAASHLESLVRARKPLKTIRLVMFAALSLTGVSLALMLWPQPAGASTVAVALIHVVVIIMVTLISVTFAALPASRDAMLFSFWLTTSGLILFHPGGGDPGMIAVVTLTVLGIRIYGSSTGHHVRSSAQMLVENRQLSEDLADALAHAEFLSWRDPLTGLFNRRMLFEDTRSDRSPLSRHLLTIDLDRFKTINDTFGHGVGDHVLVATADTIREWCASLGGNGEHQAFRLGGEEFLVIARGLDEATASEAAERLRIAISEIEGQFSDHPGIAITASIGLASWRFGEGMDDALLRSDIACYEAKNTGRNRVRRAA